MSIHETDLRLIEQLEFVSFDGKREFGLQRQALLELPPYRVFEHHEAAAPGCLGAIEGQMAVAQQFVRGPAVGREHRSADRDLEAMRTGVRQYRGVECEADAIGELTDAFPHFSAGKRDGEFVAA